MSDVYIEDFSYILTDQTTPTKEIKKELESKSEKKYRRINRYIILALAGVYNMPNIKNINSDCALVIGTKNGCITETISMLDQVHNSSLLPMPFTFIASSTNMVNFYVAQSLNLNGSNFMISNRYSPFAIALDVGYFDIIDNKTKSALIGCVDEIAEPLDKFKQKIGVENKKIQEGSFWVKISSEKENAKAIIKKSKRYKSIEDAKKEIEPQRIIFENDTILNSKDTNKESLFLCSNGALKALRSLEEKRYDKVAIIAQIGAQEFLLLSIDNLR